VTVALRIRFRVVCTRCNAQLFLQRRIERWWDWRGLRCTTCGPLRVHKFPNPSSVARQRERGLGYLTIRAYPTQRT
jgi:DNA-directed RNA polymerase subunit RPC12/RpoP